MAALQIIAKTTAKAYIAGRGRVALLAGDRPLQRFPEQQIWFREELSMKSSTPGSRRLQHIHCPEQRIRGCTFSRCRL
ncbi:hypothetical protein BV898_19421 [Hypsibius exemplaris]|uniref:Uncharacterized protein n=1 Tax=Hypsibius exemplaris TaxID=2072580 RepID=A0A9X6NLL8_HYPEX|nr:hypothetical protein BV898_19421 [Hypsibius exemplaris]